MSLALSDLVAERSVGPRRRKRAPRRALIAGGALAAVAVAVTLGLAFGGDGGDEAAVAAPVAVPAGAAREVETEVPAAPEAPKHQLPPDVKALLAAYPGKPLLDGLEMLASGDVEAAEEWLGNYLAAPTDGRDDQATLALAVVYQAKGETAAAESTLETLVRQRTDSPRSGDGYYLLGAIRSADGRLDEAEKAFLEAVRVYEKSHGGRRAAKRLADDLYEQHVKGYPKRTEWERIRDLYSISMRGLVDRDAVAEGRPCGLPADWSREEIVARLDEMNQWVIFTTHARPKRGYPSNVCFHKVGRGDTLGGIAKHYGVAVGSVRRLNGIPRESHVIRPGQELKIVRGRTEIFVDTRDLVMTVWIDRRFFREYRIGIGREGRTPVGEFKVVSPLVDPDWTPPGSETIPFGDPRNILGTRWLGFERIGAGQSIGIHGSRLADGVWEGVGERASNGCIRMRNPDVEELFDFVPVGTEVTIHE
jgi:lipoprotein-anchoring transpeptidase ErfK/SrfK